MTSSSYVKSVLFLIILFDAITGAFYKHILTLNTSIKWFFWITVCYSVLLLYDIGDWWLNVLGICDRTKLKHKWFESVNESNFI